MKTTTANIVLVALILASIGASIVLYPALPESMTSHWGIRGEPNGFMSRFWAAFFAPMLMAFMFGLFLVLPTIDPLKHNVASFRGSYNIVVTSIIGFIAVIHAYVLAWNMGLRAPVMWIVMPLMSLLFFIIGSVLPKTKQNWFMGIRTPWTMSSEAVWRKTHEHAGKVFQWSALVMLLSVFFPRGAFAIVIAVALGCALWVTYYSYLVYTKLQKH